MNQTCPECGAELEASSLIGAIPSILECARCGASLSWDEGKKAFRLSSPKPEAVGPTMVEPRDPLSPVPTISGEKAIPLSFKPDKSAKAAPISAQVTAPSSPLEPSAPSPVVSPSDAPPGGPDVASEEKDGLVGRTIGGCEILKWIGRGGMGAVYMGRQVSLDRLVAFKVIGEGVQRDESFLRRFEREARTIAKFNSSRIVQIYEVGFDQGIHYILMEFIPGGDLKRKTAEAVQIPPEEATRYIREAAEGLLAAEKQKIIHRDLKPENLMLDANGEIKITDFGLAKTLQTDITLTQMGDYLGTPVYMSPEQAQGITLDHRSDMYSLGATFYFLLTGNPPYTGGSIYEILKKKTEFQFLDPSTSHPVKAIPEGLCNIIRRMTALQPKDRYPSFKDLIEDLDRYQRGEPTRVFRRRGPLARNLAAALVLAVLVAGAIRYRDRIAGLIVGSPSFPEETRPRDQLTLEAEQVRASLVSRMETLKARVTSEGPGRELLEKLTTLRSDILASKYNNDLAEGANGLIRQVLEAFVVKFQGSIDGLRKDFEKKAYSSVAEQSATLRGEIQDIKCEFTDIKEKLDGEHKSLESLIQDCLGALVVQYREGVQGLRDRMKEGPNAIILGPARDLRDRLEKEARWSIWQESPQLKEELEGSRTSLDGFILDVEGGQTILVRLKDEPRIVVAVPFQDLPSRLKARLEILTPGTAPGPDLKGWLEAERKKLVEGTGKEAEEALRSYLRRAEAEEGRFLKGEPAEGEGFPGMVEALQKSKEALAAAFPESEGRWEEVIPAARLEEFRSKVRVMAGRTESLRLLIDRVAAIEKLFPDPKNAAAWTPELEAEVKGRIDKGKKDLEALRKDAGKEDVLTGDVEKRIGELESRYATFEAHARGLAEALESFQARRLKAAEGSVEKLKSSALKDPRVDKLSAALSAMKQGFDALLDDLNLKAAEKHFLDARAACQEGGWAGEYVDRCLGKLSELKGLTDGAMAPVIGGRVRISGSGASQDVKAFFIDRLEVTVEEYLKHLEELRKRSYEEVKDIWPTQTLFQRDLNKPQYLSQVQDPNPRWPIEEVNYYQALAFLSSRKKDLFTLEEWWLAVRGSEESPIRLQALPQEPKNARRPVEVDLGGESINLRGVHHLAGNVAEWTRAEKEANRSQLVGIRYRDSEDKFFSGEKRYYMDLGETGSGYGFRGVIRSAEFFEGLLPLDR